MSRKITYRFEVKITQTLAENDDDVGFYTEDVATSVPHRRSLERTVFDVLRRVEGDADCELLDFSVEEE